MKLSRDSLLGIGILLALVLITVIASFQQNKTPPIPYLSTSSAPDGTLALKSWLGELGYTSVESSQTLFNLQNDIKLIFILQPIVNVSDGEWKLLDEWIERGGVLVLAGENPYADAAMDHFDFSTIPLGSPAVEFSFSSPMLDSPSIESKITSQARMRLKTTRADFLPLVSAKGKLLIVSLEQGKGRVIVSSTPYPFSNIALKDDSNAAMVLNLLGLAGQKGAVWFDEWHHGFQSNAVIGPSQWLQHTPGGHASLFVTGVIFLALLLQGRAFGRPVPLVHEIKRRGPLEHVTAIANLNRKAGHGNEVLRQYHQRLKRHLGHRYRLDPSLNDAEYVDLLVRYNPAVDKEALSHLLKRLSQKNVSESELLKLASEASLWIDD